MRSTSCVGFARQESDDNAIRDATMILKFRHLLETHELTSVLFDELKRVSGREKALDAGWQHSRSHHHSCAVIDLRGDQGKRRSAVFAFCPSESLSGQETFAHWIRIGGSGD